jgi:hypothetical protein
LADCLKALDQERALLESMRGVVDTHDAESPIVRFQKGSFDAALTARFQNIVDRSLKHANKSYAPGIECRGLACRVKVPTSDYREVARLINVDPEFQTVSEWQTVSREGLTWSISASPRPLGSELLDELQNRINLLRAAESCHARYPGNLGRWTAQVETPDGLRPSADPESWRIDVRPSGKLAPTPVGACMLHLVTEIAQEIEVPRNVRWAMRSLHFDFPPTSGGGGHR